MEYLLEFSFQTIVHIITSKQYKSEKKEKTKKKQSFT